MRTASTADLVGLCRRGRQQAWDVLVERLTPLMWSIARSHGLSVADCEDVVQASWVRVLRHLDAVQSAETFASWVGTITRREALRHLEMLSRHTPVGDATVFDHAQPPGGHAEDGLVRREQDQEVLDAFRCLSSRCQELLALLSREPAPSYDEISAALDMPRGSIGPTRARCLERLEQLLRAGADRQHH